MSIQDTSSIGSPLDQIRRDMMKLPPEVFASYLQNPDNTPNGGIAFSLLVGLEAARRQKIEADRKRQEQPDPSRIPTIAEELRAGQMRDMEGVPTYKTGIAASAQPAAAPPAAPAPAPVAAAPAPAPAPAPVAMAGPTVKRAHGGIIAFNGEERSDVPKQEPLRRQYPKEMAERNILADLFSGVGPTLEDFVQGLKGFKGYEARRAEARGESKATPSGTPFPESGTELAPAPTAIAKPTPKPAPRPAVALTPTAPAVPAVPAVPAMPAARSMESDALAKAMEVLGAPPATLTSEQAAAARKQAEERLRGITDPRTAEIRRLQAEAEGIGSRRDEGALGRALMQFGLRTIQGGSRPGTAGSAVAGAGLEALSSYEKEQTGMIERALKVNQTKIALENELMKQGVDRNTAADLAEREARKQVADVEREKRDSAKDLGTLAIQKQQANTALERAQNQLTIAEMRVNEAIRRSESQAVINALSAQVRTAELALKQAAAATLSPKDRFELEKLIGESWSTVGKDYYSQLPGGQKLVADLAAGRVKESELPPEIRNAAKDLYRQSLVGGTSRAGAFTPSNTDVLKTLRGG